jgi:hypothetical protein
MVLALRDFVLDRLFIDLKLRVGVKGARMVDRADCRARRDSVEEMTNISWGYTGSTDAGERGGLPGIEGRAGLGGAGGLGPSRRLRGMDRRFPLRPSISFRRSRRRKQTPRMTMMRTATVEVTEIAMTADLMETNQPSKTR